MLRNPDHVTIAVADAASAIEFFALLGFRQERFATIDDGLPGRFDPRPPEDAGEHPTNLRRRGYNHLAFRVDDIKAVTATT
jgi:catechol 2,3-dioxygenase-like lactoylglutathione lyase family enzyme